MDYEFQCDCKDTAYFCSNSMIISYNGLLALKGDKDIKYDIVENLVFMSVRDRGDLMSSSLDCKKIPELIEFFQKVYSGYQHVREELKKQGKLELLSEDNKPNLSIQNPDEDDEIHNDSFLPGSNLPH